MLPFTAKEIRQYAEKQHIAYVVDYTNQDERISRNRIRHSVIPQLETINPQFLHTNIRTRQILQRQYAFYQKHLRAEIQDMLTDKDGDIRINLQKLAQNENILLILYEILHEYGFTADTVENIIVNNQIPVGRFFYSDSHILLIDRESLIIQPRFEEEENVLAEIYSMADLKTYFTIEEFEYQQDMVFSKDPNLLYIPKEKLTFPVLIRKWNPGDWFHPLGAPGSQKLSDYFIDHKIDRFAKERIRLFCIGDHIAWIISHRSDERFKVTPQTKTYYRLKPLTVDH